MSDTFQRAHRAEQKQIRRQTILAAALTRFTTQSLPEITIASIAREANLAKGSVYSYFATKEEVFLALLRDELAAWMSELDALFSGYASARPVEHVVSDIITTMRSKETMLRLLSRLFLEIEENLSMDAALGFKQWLLEAGLRTGALLERALGITPRAGDVPGALGAKYLLRLNALCTGLWPMAHPSGSVAEVLAMPEFEPLRVDFWQELEFGLVALFTHTSSHHVSHTPTESPWSI